MTYGWNSTCYQILNPGIQHWISMSAPAVVGYTRRHRTLLVAGAPVCPPEKLAEVCLEFEQFARRQDCRVCYVCAEERLRRMAGWEVVTPAQLAVVWFGYTESEATNAGLVKAMYDDGHAMLTSTVLDGRTVLRLCTINPRTTEADLDSTLDRLDSLARI